MRLNQLWKHFCHSDWGISKTCILNTSITFSGVEKRWRLILFFTYGNKKKSFGAKSGLYGGWLDVLSTQKCSESSHCRGEEWFVFGGWFSWLLGRQLANKWLWTTQNWLYCVVQAWKCFVCEQLLLELAHLEIPTQSTAVYFRAYTRKSTIHHLSR